MPTERGQRQAKGIARDAGEAVHSTVPRHERPGANAGAPIQRKAAGVNRRGFLSSLMVAPLALPAAMAACASYPVVIGVDGGAGDDIFGVTVLQGADFEFVESRRFEIEQIAQWFEAPPHLLWPSIKRPA